MIRYLAYIISFVYACILDLLGTRRDVRKPMDQRIATKRVHALFRSSRAPRDQLETNYFFQV